MYCPRIQFKVSKFQSSKVSKLHMFFNVSKLYSFNAPAFRISKCESFKVSNVKTPQIQSLKSPKFQNFNVSNFQSFPVSKFHNVELVCVISSFRNVWNTIFVRRFWNCQNVDQILTLGSLIYYRNTFKNIRNVWTHLIQNLIFVNLTIWKLHFCGKSEYPFL